MSKKCVLTLLLVFVILILSFGACAKPAPAPSPAPSPAPAPASSSTPAQAAKTITWQIVSPYAETMNLFTQLKNFCQALEQASGGRLKATPYGSGKLVTAYTELEATEAGTVQAFYGGSVLYPGRLKEACLVFGASYPGGPGPYEYHAWWYYGGGSQLEDKLYQRAGADIINIGPAGGVGPELFGWFNKKITPLADFKGLKFRTIGLWGETLKSLGAAVVTMPGGELYQALERGVIDAFELSIPSIDYPFGFQEIAKYLIIPGVHQPHSILSLFAGGKAWRELPPDLQVIVREVAASQASKGLAMVNVQDAEAWAKLKQTKVEIVTLPKSLQDEIIATARKVMDDYTAKDAFFGECVNSQLDFLKFYRPWQTEGNPIFYK